MGLSAGLAVLSSVSAWLLIEHRATVRAMRKPTTRDRDRCCARAG
jgi:hypothetical protein